MYASTAVAARRGAFVTVVPVQIRPDRSSRTRAGTAVPDFYISLAGERG